VLRAALAKQTDANSKLVRKLRDLALENKSLKVRCKVLKNQETQTQKQPVPQAPVKQSSKSTQLKRPATNSSWRQATPIRPGGRIDLSARFLSPEAGVKKDLSRIEESSSAR